MTPSGLLDLADLERLALEATLAGIDPALVLAEKIEVTSCGPGWVTAGDVRLEQVESGLWRATVADPPVQVGRALIGGPR